MLFVLIVACRIRMANGSLFHYDFRENAPLGANSTMFVNTSSTTGGMISIRTEFAY